MYRLRRPGKRAGAWSGRDLESRLVWILGSPRTGSTWLMNLLQVDPRVIGIDEPSIGAHLAVFVTGLIGVEPERVEPERMRINDARKSAPDYFFSSRYEATWRPLTRELILGRLGAEVEEKARERSIRDPLVAIKEPHGSVGADILMSLLPDSRLIFLLRDGRDVIDSELDGASAGAWAMTTLPAGFAPADRDRLRFIRNRAHAWLCRTEVVERAYQSHPSHLRMLVRYEDLLRDTGTELRSLVDWLGVRLDDDAIAGRVGELSFERAETHGPGRFARAAKPGLWRENLSSAEQALIEEIMGPKLRDLGYD